MDNIESLMRKPLCWSGKKIMVPLGASMADLQSSLGIEPKGI